MQAEIVSRKRVIAAVVRTMPAMLPRTANTGHALAPLYSPTSISAISRIVQHLRRAWVRQGEEMVAAVRTARRLARATMLAEVAAWRHDVAQQGRADRAARRAVAKQVAAAEQGHRAARVHGVSAGRKAQREARGATLTTAQAAGTAIAAEARLVRAAARCKATLRRDEALRNAARTNWLAGLEGRERAHERKHDEIARRAHVAAAVRAGGYTQEVHAVHVAAWQAMRQNAARVREAVEVGRARVGPSGGLWGGAGTWESARAPFPTKLVGAATDAPPEVRRQSSAPLEPPRVAAVLSDREPRPWQVQEGVTAELAAFLDGEAEPFSDFFTLTTGNGTSHAAKIAFGRYVGTAPTAFGSRAPLLPPPVLPRQRVLAPEIVSLT